MPNQPIDLTDDFRQDQPLAFLVRCVETTIYEYLVFEDFREAVLFAERMAGASHGDWQIYPLYAGEPLYLSDDEKLKGWE